MGYSINFYVVVGLFLTTAARGDDYYYTSDDNTEGSGYSGIGAANPLNYGSLSPAPTYVRVSNPVYSNTGNLNPLNPNLRPVYQNTGNSRLPNPVNPKTSYPNPIITKPVQARPACVLYSDCSVIKEGVIFATDTSSCYVFKNRCYLYNENCNRQNRYVPELIEISKSQCTPMCPTVCTLQYQPVCAVYNNVRREFSNSCALNTEICTKGIPYVILNNGTCPRIDLPNPKPAPCSTPVRKPVVY